MKIAILLSIAVLAYGYVMDSLNQGVIFCLSIGPVLIWISGLMNGRTGFEKSGNWFGPRASLMSSSWGGLSAVAGFPD